MGNSRIELLAPAGNYESFLGAIHAGADAVYLGGEKFGARAYADNFTGEEICRAIRYAHLFKRKVYLTVNTLIKDSEFPELIPYLEPFYEAGLDGVIVQDTGALLAIRDAFPNLALHISTQMTVTGSYTAKQLKELGAVRIVPARELSLAEIKTLKEETGLEMETFIHGAMCYCYSGQCLFSSILGGRSGNRGRCAQPCRLPYQITENGKSGAECYPLSLKDMCTISCLPKLIDAGIDSFKIEGRMKKPEYAAGVTALYRKYIDLYLKKGSAGYRVEEKDLKMLSTLYIRSDIQDGYYFRQNGADMVTLHCPAYNGSDETLLLEIRKRYIEAPLKKEIGMHATFHIGEPASLRLTCPDFETEDNKPLSVTVYGAECSVAQKQPVTLENIKSGLLKLGNTDFTVSEDSLKIEADAGLFYPLKAINELRRAGTEALLQAVLSSQQASYKETNALTDTHLCRDAADKKITAPVRVMVHSAEQLAALLQSSFPVDLLYLDCEMLEVSDSCLKDIRKKLNTFSPECSIFIALPYILRKKDEKWLSGIYPLLTQADGCIARCSEAFFWLKSKGYPKKIYTDAGLYCFNRQSLAYWLSEADGCTLPYELNRKEQDTLQASFINRNTEQIVYGRIPLMVTANCIAKTSGTCLKGQKKDKVFSLKDRYRKEFPVSLHCDFCYNILYNSVPISLHAKVSDKKLSTAMRISFTVEDKAETAKVLEFFGGLLQGKKCEPPYAEYTLGHEKRGVL